MRHAFDLFHHVTGEHILLALGGLLLWAVVGCSDYHATASREPPAPRLAVTAEADPFIGTSGPGATWPHAMVPHGLVSVGPHTSLLHGYRHEDSLIVGLGHLHVSGSPADMGLVKLLPVVLPLKGDPSAIGYPKRWERAPPGYYAVGLGGVGVRVEATATTHASLSHFAAGNGKPISLLVDAGHSIGFYGNTTTSSALTRSEGGLDGEVTSGFLGGLGDQPTLYFRLDARPLPDSVELRSSGEPAPRREWRKALLRARPTDSRWSRTPSPDSARAQRVIAILHFRRPPVAGVQLRVGVSFTSNVAATANATTEIPSWDFDSVRIKAHRQWESWLGALRAEGVTPSLSRVLTTALYHAGMHPSEFSDTDGRWRSFVKGDVREAIGTPRLTVFSLWDTWRTVHPLLTLIAPGHQRRVATSLLEMALEGRTLPLWELYGRETNAMVGDPASVVLAASATDGLADPKLVLPVLVRQGDSETGWPLAPSKGRLGLADYLRLGFVPEPDLPTISLAGRVRQRLRGQSTLLFAQARVYGGASTTLEYAHADACIARVATLAGDSATAARYTSRSRSWQNVFDSAALAPNALASRGFFRPRRSDGSWVAPFTPSIEPIEQRGFVEGNAWDYRWHVPHDVTRLVTALGGVERTVVGLRSYLDSPSFSLGNEPSLAVPWLLTMLSGGADADQRRLMRLAIRSFRNSPDGLPGNDDAGTLSAWFIWAAMGVYPIDPCGGDFALGRPLIERLEVWPAGRDSPLLRIEAPGASDTSVVFDRATWNNRSLRGWSLSREAMRHGGVLKFWRRTQP